MSSSSIVVQSKPLREESLASGGSWLLGRPAGVTPDNNASLSSDAIEIYLSTAHSVTPMRVLASDTIESVKLNIQMCKGFYAKHQMLIYDGREMARPDSLIKDYGVTDGNVLHLILRFSDLQLVRVKTYSGKKYVFRVQKNRNVQDLKQRIHARDSGLALDEQQLVFKGEQLEDKRLIEDLLLEDDAVIHLYVKKTVKLKTKPAVTAVEVCFVAPDSDNDRLPDSTKGLQCSRIQKNALTTPPQPPRLTDVIENTLENVIDYQDARPVYLVEPLMASVNCVLSPTFYDLISIVRAGLESGMPPKQSSEGCGGVYFMQDATGTRYVGVFKPVDEEPMAVNNPRGLPVSLNGEGLKRGTRVGEGAYREVAAYILDHPIGGRRNLTSDEPGFAGVPPTMMIRCSHYAFHNAKAMGASVQETKIGSLQMFVNCESSCEDMGPATFPVHEVHKIAVLDIRLANADRHGGNILICNEAEQSSIKLVPIDHGYCLPEAFEDCTFEWLYWPQAKQPYDPETLQYISLLDADMDIQLLKSHGWSLSPACSRVLQISTMLLKKGAAAGLTPYEIGCMMCREFLNKPSVIENIVEESMEAILPGWSDSGFLEVVSEIMDFYIEKAKCTQ